MTTDRDHGYADSDEDAVGVGTLSAWESLAVDAVGHFVDFWKFKRNQGRVWALLYLRGVPMSAQEIQEALGLSKGGVSMLSRELEQWGVIDRKRSPRDAMWKFVAQDDLMKMVGKVIEEREGAVVRRIRSDISRAEELAKRGGESREVLERLRRMRQLADMTDRAIAAFVTTARFDLSRAGQILSRLAPGRATAKAKSA